jgi:hypothetical protein
MSALPSITGALLTHGSGDILLMRLAFVEVRAMVCLSQETYQSFVSQSSPELTAPALESRDERARLPTA